LNRNGRLGDGTTTDRHTPVQVLGSGGIGYLNLGVVATPPTDDPTFPTITLPPLYTNGRISKITAEVENISSWNADGSIVIAINESEVIQTGTFFIDFSSVDIPEPLLVIFNNGIGTLADEQIIQVSEGEIRVFFSGLPLYPHMDGYVNGEPKTYLWLNGGEFNYNHNEVIFLQADGTLFIGLSESKPVPSWAWYGVTIDGVPFNPARMRFTFDQRGIMRQGYNGYSNGHFFLDGSSRTGFFWLEQLAVVAYFNAGNGDRRQMDGTVTRTLDADLVSTINNFLTSWIDPANNVSDFTVGTNAVFRFENGGLSSLAAL